MIKLFSLNHTRTRKFLILAQDKTQCSTSHCQDISCPKYLGQRPHELLGQLFKERLSGCSIKVAYSTSFRYLVNRLFSLFPTPKTAEKLTGLLLVRGAHSTLNRHLVNRFF